ncbi:hypothetical protein V1520DRAFT_180337 [Lipomyces starkeyi]|uniref:Uncharacterized protein n=1 Tax=Lipomyces starkeyi NRRL Y-11557 TaxID=675824 RepID=A0A1E3Q657_LIPST|nr:hypothetical protein LIPSTDRAFT_3436 [Lipomyces starkeyi NRRL Y-11557]
MSRNSETRAMLERINVLEKKASLLHAENFAANETNRELFKRIQDLNSCLIASESLVERLLNATEETDETEDDQDDFCDFDPRESRPNVLQANGGNIAGPNADTRTSSIGSISSHFNRFEILLDEFCSEFEKSDDDSSGGTHRRAKGSPQFSIQIDAKRQSGRVRQRDNKARTLSPVNVLRDIGQARSSPRPIHRKTSSNIQSPTIRSPTCLKLSLGRALGQGMASPSPASSKLRTARFRLERARIQLDQSLLPLAPSSPSAPSLKSPTEYYHRCSVSSCETPITPICLTYHRRKSSQSSFPTEQISEKELPRQSPISSTEKTLVEKASRPIATLLEIVAATTPIPPSPSSSPLQSQSLLQRYKFTSDEGFYHSPPPHLQQYATSPTTTTTTAAHSISDQQQPILRSRKSIPNLNRKTSTLSLLNGTRLSPTPASATSALDTDADINAICSSPSRRGRTMSDALKDTMKRYEIPERVVQEQSGADTQSHFESLPISQEPLDEQRPSEELAHPSSESSELQPNQLADKKGLIRCISARLWHALWGGSETESKKQPTERRDNIGPTLVCIENPEASASEEAAGTAPSSTVELSDQAFDSHMEQCAQCKAEEDMPVEDTASLAHRILSESCPMVCEGDDESTKFMTDEISEESATNERAIYDDGNDDDVRASPKGTNCAKSSDSTRMTEYVARQSLTKRASWVFSCSIPTTSSLDAENLKSVTSRLSLTWLNIFKKQSTSDDYVSFPTFSTSQSVRGFRSMTNLDRAHADSQNSWPCFSGNATTIVGGGGSNRNSIIDGLSSYNASLRGTQNADNKMLRKCGDAVYCTPVDEDLLHDALSHHISG